MKIYTRGGDEGQTSLLRGGRVAKHHPRVEAYGTFDEVNTILGVARSTCGDAEVVAKLAWLQPKLHILCGDVAADPEQEAAEGPPVPRMAASEVEELERDIDTMEEDLPPLQNFILPGGGQTGALLHQARTVARRGERRMTELMEGGGAVREATLQFANRLSDYLFVLARWANGREGIEEVPWMGSSPEGESSGS